MDKKDIKKEFTELIEQNQGIIFKVSRIYCNNTVCRDDLFQDILLQLWKSFPVYDKTRKFSTWMYRIALNTAISQWRKDKTRKLNVVDELQVSVTDNDTFDESNERAQLLNQAINKLSKAEKSIIVLYMDDYPYDEISEITGITVSNVGVKINLIKKKLQEHLKELGYGF